MKQIIGIEMANDNEIYEVSTSGELYSIKNSDDDFEIMLNGNVIDEAYSQHDAYRTLLKHAIDDDMIVTGYGRFSGKKYWQLPEALQANILQFMYDGKIDSKLTNAFVDSVINSCIDDASLKSSDVSNKIDTEIGQFIERQAGQYSEDVKNVIAYDLRANLNNEVTRRRNTIAAKHAGDL